MDLKAQLRASLKRSLGGAGRLIVASNREPFIHEHQGGRIICRQPAGGLTAALAPLLNSLGGVWVAQASGTADRDVVDRHSCVMVPPDEPAYKLHRVWLPEKLRCDYYCGLANRALWPVCHNAYQRPHFAAAEWESYREANEVFAEAILEEAAERAAMVFIQDYHLALVPRILRKRNPNLVIAHFWHIPWPSPDLFFTFPWSRELLDGMLGNNLVGFQLSGHAANFLHCAERTGAALVDAARGRVFGEANETAVGNFPIGIDFRGHIKRAAGPETRGAMENWMRRLGPNVRLGIGIDRMDYTKGIPERLRGLDLFFERHPEWRENLVFVQVAVPSRGEIPEYRFLANEIAARVAALNERWGTTSWQPVHLVNENLPAEQMMALHRLADFCLVTPLHDGMNLVAKEFVASREDLDGVLVLSRFAGAAVELSSAVLVNPFSEEDIADGIRTALTLPRADRMCRMSHMRSAVQSNDIGRWAAEIFWATAQAAESAAGTPAVAEPVPRAMAVMEAAC
jgi:alpha,alpha-trehalose-phosphate synthase [UDP-forming]